MCCLAQQSSEKIDRTRAHAGEIFLRLLYMDRWVTCLDHFHLGENKFNFISQFDIIFRSLVC